MDLQVVEMGKGAAPVNLTPRKWKQEDPEFKAIFGYIGNWRPTWAM